MSVRYHRGLRGMIRQRIPFTMLVAVVCAFAARAAQAAPVPAGEVMRISHQVDTATFTEAFTAIYDVDLRRVIVTDIDLDGDADVLAATDHDLSVWVNDGAGRLIWKPVAPAPLDALQQPLGSWHGRPTPNHDTIQNDIPAPRLPSSRATAAPPDGSSTTADFLVTPRFSAAMRGPSGPRAPPATL